MANRKWDDRFMDLAKFVAMWSKDPSTQVGCVIVRNDKTVASMGFNGFPRGVGDDRGRYNDRDTKLRFVVHAEANAVVGARASVEGMTAYCTFFPCCECAKLLIQAGIKEVVVPSDVAPERYRESMAAAKDMFAEAGVKTRVVGRP